MLPAGIEPRLNTTGGSEGAPQEEGAYGSETAHEHAIRRRNDTYQPCPGQYISTNGPGILKPIGPIRSPEGYATTAIWSILMYVPANASTNIPRPLLAYVDSMVADCWSMRVPLALYTEMVMSCDPSAFSVQS